MPFRRLLLKVEFTGIVGNALRWIEIFLLNRHQMVRVRDNLSGMEEVASGVPQGSVLGPLLFLIYVADLPGIISKNSKIRMFADDTKIYRAIKKDSDLVELQNDLYKLKNWTHNWLLNFNVAKCKHLRVGCSEVFKKFMT